MTMVNGQALEHFMSAATIDGILGPNRPDHATGLPNIAYNSEPFLELERRRLFARTWVFAGFDFQIPEPGDAMPVNPFGVPLILLRDHDGEIRCFQNVCRHRGVQLLDKPCEGAKLLTCPYHAWSYHLDGSNAQRPHFEAPHRHAADPSLSLFPVRIGQWWNMIFVNVDGNAPAFDEHIAPFARQFADYDFSSLRHGHMIPWEFDSNWKLVQENYIEPYHVFSCHPALEALTPTTDHEFGYDEHVCINGARFDEIDLERGADLPLIPGLTNQQKHQGIYIHLFPNVDIGVYPTHIHVLAVWPVAPDSTREEIHLFFPDVALGPEFEAGRQTVIDGWYELNGEDVDVVERLQKGRACTAYDGGVLSPHWDTVTNHFARLVVQAMQ